MPLFISKTVHHVKFAINHDQICVKALQENICKYNKLYQGASVPNLVCLGLFQVKYQ